jgi:hypothetical protein
MLFNLTGIIKIIFRGAIKIPGFIPGIFREF